MRGGDEKRPGAGPCKAWILPKPGIVMPRNAPAEKRLRSAASPLPARQPRMPVLVRRGPHDLRKRRGAVPGPWFAAGAKPVPARLHALPLPIVARAGSRCKAGFCCTYGWARLTPRFFAHVIRGRRRFISQPSCNATIPDGRSGLIFFSCRPIDIATFRLCFPFFRLIP